MRSFPIAVEREGELTIIDRHQSVREDTSYAQIASCRRPSARTA